MYEHFIVGYEKYNLMRSDPLLCFLSRCGPPDGAALAAEQNDDDELVLLFMKSELKYLHLF